MHIHICGITHQEPYASLPHRASRSGIVLRERPTLKNGNKIRKQRHRGVSKHRAPCLTVQEQDLTILKIKGGFFMRVRYLSSLALLFAVLLWSGPSFAVTFSIDAVSPSMSGVLPDDALNERPGPAPPPLIDSTPCGSAAPILGMGNEMDGMTCGGPGEAWYFSVDRASVGIAGTPHDVASEAAVGQAAGDVYVETFSGNALVYNQDYLSEGPSIAPGVPNAAAIDNLDALDLWELGGSLVLTLSTGNVLGVSGADLIDGTGAVVVPYMGLGLTWVDDIDALHIDDGTIYFSLVPGSPSLAGIYSPADILVSDGYSGFFFLDTPAGALGLLPSDNLDALATVPEPGTALLLSLGLGLFAARRRTRR